MDFTYYGKTILHKQGQSLLELIIAVGVFALMVGLLASFILSSYVSGRLANEITKANFLAEEGIEAVRSIRDNNWSDLTPEDHGLVISGNNWIFQGAQEDISGQLKGGVRKIVIEDINPDTKKIISQVSWQFTRDRFQQIELITYLTNWQKIVFLCQGTCISCNEFTDKKSCRKQDGCDWVAKECTGACISCEDFLDKKSCKDQSGCIWTGT